MSDTFEAAQVRSDTLRALIDNPDAPDVTSCAS